MLEQGEMNLVSMKSSDSVSKYLESREHYQIVLLDMLRANEITQKQYDEAIIHNNKPPMSN